MSKLIHIAYCALFFTIGLSQTDAKAQPEQEATISREPFGLENQGYESGWLRKWAQVEAGIASERKIVAQCNRDRANCASPVAASFLEEADHARSRNGRARLGEINRFVNLTVRPLSDERQHGSLDKWSTPLATLSSGAGDCEDYAIAKLALLQEAGVDSEELRLVIVYDTTIHEMHAVVAALSEGKWLILDNRRLFLIEDTDLSHLQPRYIIGANKITGLMQFNAAVEVASADALTMNLSAALSDAELTTGSLP